jgi:transposase
VRVVGPEGVEPGASESNGESFPQKGPGRPPIPESERLRIRDMFARGMSKNRIARETGHHKMTVYRVLHDAEAKSIHKGPAPSRPSFYAPPRSTGGGKELMPGESDSLEVRLARLQWERERDAEENKSLRQSLSEVAEGLKKATRQPPAVELHDGSAHVSCPNCGTSRDVPLPAAPSGPGTFDELLDVFAKGEHKESPTKKWTECPNCRPKVEATLKGMGYELKPLAPPSTDE